MFTLVGVTLKSTYLSHETPRQSPAEPSGGLLCLAVTDIASFVGPDVTWTYKQGRPTPVVHGVI